MRTKNQINQKYQKPEQKHRGFRAKLCALAAYASVAFATPAWAVTSVNDVLPTVLNLIQQGVTFLGGALIVWGAVKLGLAIKDQSGGNALSEAIATIAGGAVVIGAAVFFGQLSY